MYEVHPNEAMVNIDILRDQNVVLNIPYPEDFNKKIDEDETPPVIKRVVRNHKIEGLFRWGVKYKTSGNHRILYIIHNHYKVVLLHYFDKQYNGDIRHEDIKRAEDVYESYCSIDPFLY